MESLVALCNGAEGVELPISVEPANVPKGEAANQFLYYEAGALVGYANMQGVAAPEVCGGVHPAHRRKGIGTALLEAAKEECRERGSLNVLLVCDEAGESGKAFARALGLEYRFSEYSMRLDPSSVGRLRGRKVALRLRRAGLEDAEVIARITAAAFDDPVEMVRRNVERGLNAPNQRYFVAEMEGEPIGTLRVGEHEPTVYVTAFGVLPGLQGRGYGRQMLSDIVAMLVNEGRNDIRIEVETNNRNALSLYESCGFKVTSTYGYYRVEL